MKIHLLFITACLILDITLGALGLIPQEEEGWKEEEEVVNPQVTLLKNRSLNHEN